jgi:Ribonuclease G/E
MVTAKTSRKKKTAAELKADLEALKKKMEVVAAKAYEGELTEAIAATTIVAQIETLQKRYKDIPAINILQAIGKAAKIPRVVVTQSEPQKRASKKSN